MRRCGGWFAVALATSVAGAWGQPDTGAQQAADPVTLAWEAEDYTWILPHVLVKEREGASGGRCLTVAWGISPGKSGVAYRLQVPQDGTYYLWSRGFLGRHMCWEGWGRFLVDGAPAGPGLGLRGLGEWEWTRGVTEARAPHQASPSIDLTAGVHTLTLGAPGICCDGLVYYCGLMDSFLLTTDPGYVPLEGPTVAASPGIILPQEPPKALIVLEGEDGADARAFRVVELADAVRGKALAPVRDAPQSSARFPVSVPSAGEYFLWARTWFSVDQHMARYPEVRLRIAGQELTLAGGYNWCGHGDPPYTEYWAWVRDSHHARAYRGDVELWVPTPVQLAAGDNMLELVSLGRGTHLDQLAICSAPDWVPANDGRGPVAPEE